MEKNKTPGVGETPGGDWRAGGEKIVEVLGDIMEYLYGEDGMRVIEGRVKAFRGYYLTKKWRENSDPATLFRLYMVVRDTVEEYINREEIIDTLINRVTYKYLSDLLERDETEIKNIVESRAHSIARAVPEIRHQVIKLTW